MLAATEQVEVRDLVDELRATLDALGAEQAAEVRADLSAVEAQLASVGSAEGIIREALTSTRTLLDGAAGSGLATAAPHLTGLLERLAHFLA